MRTLLLAVLLGLASPAVAQEAQPGPVWPKLSQSQRDEVQRFGDDFKQFIGRAKSAMTFVQQARTMIEAAGFKPWPGSPSKADVRPGTRWYAVNRDRTIIAFVIGSIRSRPAHGSSTRTTIRCTSSSSRSRSAKAPTIQLLDTLVHGGIKNYQWVNRPLALIGRVVKADGTVVNVDIGHAAGDPVLLIPDLAPHVDQDFRERRNRDVIQTEELDPVLALTAEAAMQALRDKYGLTRDDFLSTDLQIVPAQMPVDVGLDRQLIGAFGHDDRSNGFASFRAIVEVRNPAKTAIAYGVNNEEVSSWTTGVDSEWFRTRLAEIIAAQETSYSDLMLRHALGASQGARVRLHDRPRSQLSAAVPAGRVGPAWLGPGLQGIRVGPPGRQRVLRAAPAAFYDRGRPLADARVQSRLRRRHDRAVVCERRYRRG